MTIVFKVAFKRIEKSSAPNASTVILEKQAWQDGVLQAISEHACSFVVDPADAGQLAAMRKKLGAVANPLLGLDALPPPDIEAAIQAHSDAWSNSPPVAPQDFLGFVEKAIKEQPEFAAVKAAKEAREVARAAVELERKVIFGAGTLGPTDKQADNVFIAAAENGG